jgi:hypothetical protein
MKTATARSRAIRQSLRFEGENSMALYNARLKLREANERYLNVKATAATGKLVGDAWRKVWPHLKDDAPSREICRAIGAAIANAYKKGCLSL